MKWRWQDTCFRVIQTDINLITLTGQLPMAGLWCHPFSAGSRSQWLREVPQTSLSLATSSSSSWTIPRHSQDKRDKTLKQNQQILQPLFLGHKLPSQPKGGNPPFLVLDCPEILTLIPTLLTLNFKLGLETANHGNLSASSGKHGDFQLHMSAQIHNHFTNTSWVLDNKHNHILLPQCTLVA